MTDLLGFHASVSGSLKYPGIMHDKKITNQGYSGIRLEHRKIHTIDAGNLWAIYLCS